MQLAGGVLDPCNMTGEYKSNETVDTCRSGNFGGIICILEPL